MNWREEFDRTWEHYRPPTDDPNKVGIWSGGDYEQMKDYISTKIIKKIIDDAESEIISEYWNGTIQSQSTGNRVKQQLLKKWLETATEEDIDREQQEFEMTLEADKRDRY